MLRPRSRSLCAGAVLALALTPSLVGCGDGDNGDNDNGDSESRASAKPTVPVADAEQTYGALVAAVADELAGSVGEPGIPQGFATYSAGDEPGVCLYQSDEFSFSTWFGQDVPWDQVRDAVAAVVTERGFELTDQLDIPGGFEGFDAVGEDGATLEVRAKAGSTVELEAPVLGSCPEAPSTSPATSTAA